MTRKGCGKKSKKCKNDNHFFTKCVDKGTTRTWICDRCGKERLDTNIMCVVY